MNFILIDFRPVFLVIGLLLIVLSGGMVIPAVVDASLANPDWAAFAASAAFTLFVGTAMVITSQNRTPTFSVRQAFLLTTLSWIVLPGFASLPLMISNLQMDFTNAFFESMSGITTTGATVIENLAAVSPGTLLWRGILQWLGGLGIIIMALTLLPMLRVGGMQMFKVEAFDTQEKILPRAAQLAGALVALYSGMTLLWTFLLWIGGMTGLDAVIHAMTTIATGGYSTRDSSIGYYDSALIDTIVTLGMIAGSIPFLLYLQVLRGRPVSLIKDSQVHWFLGILFFFVAIMVLWLIYAKNMDLGDAVRFGSFNVVSIMTGTGYSTTNFGLWGSFSLVIMFMLMFVGGCAGSTTCGIKIFRFIVLYEAAKVQLARLLQPHGVFIPYFNNQPIEEGVSGSVMGFFFLYALSVCVLAVLLSSLGLDFVTAMTGAASAISNVGPGLGDVIGPTKTYSSLPDLAKWLLCIGMLLGRLELYAVFVLLIPRFWRA